MTVLPPVHLGVHLDTELLIPELSKGTNEDLINSQGFPSQDGTEPLGSGQETGSVDEDTADPEYYLNAFYCVVLGVVIMIVLFFVCKFLNDLQVSPRSGLCRRRRGYPCRDLVESLPVSLKGHRQVCPRTGLVLRRKCQQYTSYSKMAAILVFFCFHANCLMASLSNVKFNRIFNLERGHKDQFAWKQKNT